MAEVSGFLGELALVESGGRDVRRRSELEVTNWIDWARSPDSRPSERYNVPLFRFIKPSKFLQLVSSR
jgi:hypothetical protein